MSRNLKIKTGVIACKTPVPGWERHYTTFKQFSQRLARALSMRQVRCESCGKRTANFGDEYRGLCSDCWCALLLHFMERAARWLDRHTDRWGEKRPDTQIMAMNRIKKLDRKSLLRYVKISLGA